MSAPPRPDWAARLAWQQPAQCVTSRVTLAMSDAPMMSQCPHRCKPFSRCLFRSAVSSCLRRWAVGGGVRGNLGRTTARPLSRAQTTPSATASPRLSGLTICYGLALAAEGRTARSENTERRSACCKRCRPVQRRQTRLPTCYCATDHVLRHEGPNVRANRRAAA